MKIFYRVIFIVIYCCLPLGFASAAGTCQDIMVPLYVYPDTWNPKGAWNRAIDAPLPEGSVRYLIVNMNSGPGDGPGSPQYTDYSAAIAQVRARNNPDLLVCGYVRTNFANYPIATVKKEISQYYDWYNVDCIFLDEAATSAEKIPYYQEVVNFHNTRAAGSDVVLNHGFWPDQQYMFIATARGTELLHVVTENSHDAYITHPALSAVPQWVQDWPQAANWRLVHLVHSVPDIESMRSTLQLSAARNAGGIYITDDVLDNPWDWNNGEPYWEALATETTLDCQ